MEEATKIYGIRAVIEAIQSGKTLGKVFVQKGLHGELFKELEILIRRKGIPVSYVPVEKLNRLTKSNHQGVVALSSPVSFPNFEELTERIISSKKAPFFLLLDQLSDVRNFGAIIRTAECTGVDAIIVQKAGSAPVTPDTVKTSAGAVFNVPITKVDHLKDAIFYLQSSGITVVAATEKTNHSVYDTDFNQGIAIVMGSEDKGVSPSILKTADYKAKLPLLGQIGSLNVSVACGVFLYEAVRQRSYNSPG